MFDGPPPRTQHARQIVPADFNGDGRADFYIADHGYDAPPWPGYPDTLALSEPGGKLVDASKNLPQRSDFTHSAAAAAVDRDGDVDVYAGNLSTSAPPAILLNDGRGHFTLAEKAIPDFMTAEPPHDRHTRETFADVNGDGSQDLVLLSEGSPPGDPITWGRRACC